MATRRITNAGISSSAVLDAIYVNGTKRFEVLADGSATIGVSGTWTPALQFGGAAVGVTYSVQSGYYTRIGALVTAYYRIELTSKGSSTGAMTITGLPVSVNANYQYTPGDVTFPSGAASLSSPIIRVTTATTMELMNQSSAALVALTDTNATDTLKIRGQISYIA